MAYSLKSIKTQYKFNDEEESKIYLMIMLVSKSDCGMISYFPYEYRKLNYSRKYFNLNVEVE